MKKTKPLIFWLFAMQEEQRNAVYNSIDDFTNAMTKFITIDFEKGTNILKIVSYNMEKEEDTPYINKIHKILSKHYSISDVTEL